MFAAAMVTFSILLLLLYFKIESDEGIVIPLLRRVHDLHRELARMARAALGLKTKRPEAPDVVNPIVPHVVEPPKVIGGNLDRLPEAQLLPRPKLFPWRDDEAQGDAPQVRPLASGGYLLPRPQLFRFGALQ
eukprot:gene24100-29244_t